MLSWNQKAFFIFEPFSFFQKKAIWRGQYPCLKVDRSKFLVCKTSLPYNINKQFSSRYISKKLKNCNYHDFEVIVYHYRWKWLGLNTLHQAKWWWQEKGCWGREFVLCFLCGQKNTFFIFVTLLNHSCAEFINMFFWDK